MKNVPENELFSAYVDGELTADEQAQVEQLLAASPAARQLVDELRALSSSLQALPTHKVGEDITARVLRRAEREMLSERAPADPPPPAVTQPESYGWKATLSRMARPRNLVWPGAAVAVALLLLLTDPTRFREAPDRAVATRTPAGADESDASPSMGGPEEVEAEMVADEAAPAPATPPTAALAESLPASRPAKAPMAGRDVRAGYGYPPGGEGGARGSGGGGLGLAATRETAGKMDRVGGEEIRGRSEPQVRPSMAAEEADPVGLAAQKPGGGAAQKPAAGVAVVQPRADVQRPDPSLLVLSYCVTAEAARQGVFDKLVEKQAISQIAQADTLGRKRTRAAAIAENVAPQDSRLLNEAKAAEGARGFIQVDVEATRDQISALLGDLNDRADQFSFLAYDDSALGVQSLDDEAAPRGPGQMAAGKPSEGPARPAREALAEADDVRRKKGEGVDLDALLFGRGLREGVGQVLRRTEAGQAAAEEADQAKSEEAKEKQKSSAEAKDADRSAPPARALKRQLGLATYRVRFVLQVVDVDKFSVAASVAGESRAVENAAKDAYRMAEPAEPAQPAAAAASAAPLAEGKP